MMKPFRSTPHTLTRTFSAALTAMCLSYAPAANAGELLHGIFGLAGLTHGTANLRADYARTPHRNARPAIAARHGVPTVTGFAPYEPYVDGGSVVNQHPIVLSHGPSVTHRSSHYGPVVAKPSGHHRLHGDHGHGHLVGVKRTRVRCTGYASRPGDDACVVVSSKFIPINSYLKTSAARTW